MNGFDRTVSFKTLGCKLNQAETESLAAGFRSLGWRIVDFGSPSEVVVVNSCTVTNTADRKSRAVMRQALRSLPVEDSGLVVMTGCFVDGHRDLLESDGRTCFVDNGHKNLIPQMVEAHRRGELLSGQPETGRDPFGFPLTDPVFRTRAMIKVQDGCDNFCTFCIIPFVRGRAVSRPLADTVTAVTDAIQSGYREVVLTGVNMSRWTEGERGFSDLVNAVLEVDGDFRLRLGSVEPDRIDIGLLEAMTHRKMTPHMHLCLQSGSERVLLAMRRQYTAAGFEELAGALRRTRPDFNLTTDIIVGFPGERDEDFEDTLTLCRRIGFGHIHTFPYSRRDGTRADRMPDQVPEPAKKERADAVRRLSVETKYRYRKSLCSSTCRVLTESARMRGDGRTRIRGLSETYVPVSFNGPPGADPETLLNRFMDVLVTGVGTGDDPDLTGTLLDQSASESA